MPFSRGRAAFWMGSLALTVVAMESLAAGLGPINVQSSLGQQLRASIPVVGIESNDLVPSCVKAKLESQDGLTLNTPRIGLERSDQGASIHLSTREAINEPTLSILIELGCAASVRRTYQILLDPVSTLPIAESSLQSASTVVAAPHAATSDAQSRAAPSSNKTKSTRHVRKSRKDRATTQSVNASQAPAAPQAASPAPTAQAKSAQRNVLRMAPLDDRGVNPPAKSVGTPVQPGGASPSQQTAEVPTASDSTAAAAPSDEAAQNSLRAMIKSLQAEADALAIENDRITKQIAKDRAALKSRQDVLLTRIQSLALLVLVFLIALIWLAWRFNAMRKSQPGSWDELIPDAESARAPKLTDTPRRSGGGADVEHDKMAAEQARSPVTRGDIQASEATEDGAPVKYSHTSLNPFLFSNRVETAIDDSHRSLKRDQHLKAEEVSDVMELVEVWMALHEPNKVLELLEPFKDVEHPESPLPWLCLLDVYSSMNDQEKYEAILWRITKLFNVKLAPWNARADLRQPGTLADFPHLVAKILALWDSDDIGPYLEHLLVDTREGTRAGFNLAVYRDLARLAALAKDIDRPRQLDQLKRNTAYAMLFAERTPVFDSKAKPVAAQIPAPQTKPKPHLRVRPKYITTSYEGKLTGRDAAGAASAPVAPSHPDVSDHVDAATNVPADDAQAPPEHDMSSMNIKLRLAIAYQDMGDTDGARMLLDEVLHDGTPEQREQAASILQTFK